MKNYLVATPWWLRLLYHDLNWSLPVQGKKVFLTFDDGPTPEITEWTLEQLDKYEAKATFFLIGKNIQENPAIFQKLKSSGHSLGNHTHNHLNGWKNDKQNYLQNVAQCDKLVSTSLFRPPYGRITKGQAAAILKSHKVIMWSILSGDFDTLSDAETCYQNVVKNVKPGAIIVFHDSVKAWPRLKDSLPRVLDFLKKEGYEMEAIPYPVSSHP